MVIDRRKKDAGCAGLETRTTAGLEASATCLRTSLALQQVDRPGEIRDADVLG